MEIKKIVCCTDFSDSSNNAFNNAVAMAKIHKASLDLIHVREPIVNPLITVGEGGLSPEAIHATLDKIREKMEADYRKLAGPDIPFNIIVREGHPSTQILDYLQESGADLVVVGSRGISGMGLVIFGSVSRRIAQKSPCNVFVSRRRKNV